MPSRKNSTPSPKLLSLATAVPKYKMRQSDIEAFGASIFSDRASEFERIRHIYANAGVETRYSCVDMDWYASDHGWPERNQLYVENAVSLLRKTTLSCLEKANLQCEDIDGVMTVSTTGIST
ncbi:MAG: type III polyketide synthase, partial [Alphaproteobacteria bacterium]